MYCGEQTLVKYDGQERLAVSLKCRSWTCPDCAEVRKAGLTAQAIGGAPNKFLTLTSKRVEGQTPGEAARKLAHAWRLLRLRTMRRYKLKCLPFIAVFQATKLGWPHLHILLRSQWIDQTWISEVMKELIGAPIVDIRAIDSPGRIGAYVSRYVTRATERFDTCKRYWQSKDYDKRQSETDDDKKLMKTRGHGDVERRNIHEIVRLWKEIGWEVLWLDARRALCKIPP